METIYKTFLKYLNDEEKEKCVNYILDLLKENSLDIVTLYQKILTPAMYDFFCESKTKNICIWKEHVRSSIVRTIIECTYLFVQKERKEKYNMIINKKIAVVCPVEEYHELGAIMVSNYFDLLGYAVTYVGGNTPKSEFKNIFNVLNFNYIAFSITDPYNLVQTKKTIDIIKESDEKIKILVGGYAFLNNKDLFPKIGADYLLQSFEDILKFREGDSI
jgi:methanogenic corrinoid protein MtbC1